MGLKNYIYIVIFIFPIWVFFIINIPKNIEQYCNNISATIAEHTLEKYKDYIEKPINTLFTINTFRNSQESEKTDFVFVYNYPLGLTIYYNNNHHTFKLKKNETKQITFKVYSSKTSRTYYKFTAKVKPKKYVSLKTENIILLKQDIFNKPYLLDRLLNKYHKIIIGIDTCEKYNNSINNQEAEAPKSKPEEKIVEAPIITDNQSKPYIIDTSTEKNTKVSRVFIIFDKSGSLNEFEKKPLKLVKQTISSILSLLLDKNTKVTIGAFDDNAWWFFENIDTDNNSITLVKNFISDIVASGGTNLYKILNDSSKKRIVNNIDNYLIIITDGFVGPSNFSIISRKLRKKFKNIVLIGTGVEINVEFINHLATLLKATIYLITDEDDIKNLERALKSGGLKIRSENRSQQTLKISQQSTVHNKLSNIKTLKFSDSRIFNSLHHKSRSAISFTKLYLVDRDNISDFNISSVICNSFSIPEFKPFGYNEFLHNILFKSVNYAEKIILSAVKIDTLTKNSKLKKKFIDILYHNYSLHFTKRSDNILYRKTYRIIDVGNYLVKFTFRKFKTTRPYNNIITINNCSHINNNKNYNDNYILWLIISIIIVVWIKVIG